MLTVEYTIIAGRHHRSIVVVGSYLQLPGFIFAEPASDVLFSTATLALKKRRPSWGICACFSWMILTVRVLLVWAFRFYSFGKDAELHQHTYYGMYVFFKLSPQNWPYSLYCTLLYVRLPVSPSGLNVSQRHQYPKSNHTAFASRTLFLVVLGVYTQYVRESRIFCRNLKVEADSCKAEKSGTSR